MPANGKIAIVGNSGSGKSTLARMLSRNDTMATLDLDTIAWEPGQVAIARPYALAAADVDGFCLANRAWIVEGCYAELIRASLAHQPLLLFLDPGLQQCTDNCRARPWEPHKYSSQADQDAKLEYLLSWIADYYSRDNDMSLAAHNALFDEYAGPKRKLEHLIDTQTLSQFEVQVN